ncbi:ESCRT-III subunit protein snf7 [Umbelopsis sp. WA50703]
MNLFFGKGKSKTTAKDSIVKLRETLSMLEKRQAHLETKAENEYKIAKLNATKNRRVALMALKKKKAYDAQIDKINGTRMTIETQVMAIENANVNLETMNALRGGAEAMKNIHGSMDINKVDATMDEIRDQMDIANEISDAISRPVLGDELDEDELLNELEELEQEELDAKMLESAPPAMRAPNVPSHEPAMNTAVEDDEEAELKKLQASMAM